ncbi:MAG: glycosyltransferase family 4 protein [Bacteroidota bacterium]
MRILQICSKFPFPANDGGNIAILKLTEGFLQLGHQVTILAISTHKHPFNKHAIPSTFKNKIDIHHVPINTNINLFKAFTIFFFSKIPYNLQRFKSSRFEKKLKRLLQNQTFDIIQLEGLYTALYTDIIKRYSQSVLAMRAHNVEYIIWKKRAMFESHFFKKIYFRHLAKRMERFETMLLNKYDLLIPISQADSDIFINKGCTIPIHIVPCGYNPTEIYHSNKNFKQVSLFFIGALDWIPNQEGLLWFLDHVWNEIMGINPNSRLTIAGRNAPQKFVKKIMRTGVHYVGEVDDAKQFITGHQVMIVPLFSGSGMRVKIIEGMALGKTIIATPLAVEGINCENNKHIFIANSKDIFLLYINNILRNPDLIYEIGKNANNLIRKQFDNFIIVEQLTSFYKKFL